ncbi:DUF2795 domain-containing protein [Rhodovulum sp. 12E13]|uniref:DUF2795 domain-containing protein n=1 Tax=Rhodovulum sp. 12E13 TaxID=2203891 RepID=UPI000E19E465|nr:DUF2795 domain-containing protein [Rhodovulum sp. 12E13]RDC72339.1 DUF2795 domain-containing protein [Rhodovulum sp. 12E13]
MSRHRCEICGAEFDTLSEYRRHMQTSHPERAPSAADLEQALSGMEYPASRDALARHAHDSGADEIADILEQLPDRDYRDAADVARAFGGIRAHEEKPDDQPSRRGGDAAMQTEAISAARAASLFAEMEFPASAEDLKSHARAQAGEREMDVISRLPDRRYSDMSDVAQAFGEVKGADRS